MEKRLARPIALPLCLVASAASAHIEFSPADAPTGKPFTGTLMVMHGCAGSPTKLLRVQVPEGVVDVKPRERPGWSLKTVIGRYAHPWTADGHTFTEGVQEIIWSGRLPPHEHGAFALDLRLAIGLPKGAQVFFPTVQECEKGVERWIDKSNDADDPAPNVRVHATP